MKAWVYNKIDIADEMLLKLRLIEEFDLVAFAPSVSIAVSKKRIISLNLSLYLYIQFMHFYLKACNGCDIKLYGFCVL